MGGDRSVVRAKADESGRRSGRTALGSGDDPPLVWPMGPGDPNALVLDRDGAAAVALARVLAGAAVVARRAAAHALASVHPLAAVLRRRRAPPLALARALLRAALIP